MMAANELREERESLSRPPVKPIERETVPVFGVEPPWKLPSALWELWRERRTRQRESRQQR
jgi:hypothetical protein